MSAMPEQQLDEIRARWQVVPVGEQYRLTVTGSTRPGCTHNALRHAPEDVHALLAEIDRLNAQVAAVRAFATSHEYRWLHELLDGYGTHGGAL